MTIPVTAGTRRFTPACLAEMQGAPSFTLRDATRKDRRDRSVLLESEGYMTFSDEQIRKAIIEELRAGWTSEGMEQNITRLEAYWQATDEHALALRAHANICLEIISEAKDAKTAKLPPAPELDFDKADASVLEALVIEVTAHSRRISQMNACNTRFRSGFPVVCLRMLLRDTTLDVKLERHAGVLSEDCAEMAIEALAKWAEANGANGKLAALQLLGEAAKSFALDEDEEKNSSSPHTGSTDPKSAAKNPSSSTTSPEADKGAPSTSATPSEPEAEAGSSSSV